MKKSFVKIIVPLLIIALISVFTGCSISSNTSDDITGANVESININKNLQTKNLADIFDSYVSEENATYNRITAFKTCNTSDIEGRTNVSLGDTDTVSVAYDIQYNYDEELIYLAVSMFDENDNLLSVETAEAYPIYFDDGTFDASFNFDGKIIYLSDLQAEEVEDCFALTLVLGSVFLANLITAAIITAEVVIVVTGVVAVGYATYKVVSLTKEKIQAREKAATKEKTKKNPSIYYPATRIDGKLCIAASPVTLRTAAKYIITGVDYWSAYGYTAKNLAITASGGYVGPEIDSHKAGYYYHYHLLNRVGGHSFYGTPSGGVY